MHPIVAMFYWGKVSRTTFGYNRHCSGINVIMTCPRCFQIGHGFRRAVKLELTLAVKRANMFLF